MNTEILNERELPETQVIWAGYTYVINGEPTVLVLPEGARKMTVAEYKAANTYAGAESSEIRSIKNCDMKGRDLPLKRQA